MAALDEDIERTCFNLLSEKKCNFDTFEREILTHYNRVQTIYEDINILKPIFVSNVLKLCENEFEEIINENFNSSNENPHKLQHFWLAIMNTKGFDGLPHKMQMNFYKIIQENRELFCKSDLMEITEKSIALVRGKLKEVYRNEFEFVECLESVIKESDLNYEIVMNRLGLKDFFKKVFSLDVVLGFIKNSSFPYNSYEKLVNLASEVSPSEFLINFMKIEFSYYVEDQRVTFTENETKNLLIKRKILFLDNLQDIPTNINGIRMISDIFHIRSSKTLSIDNLEIIADVIKVHKKVTIDLSGKEVRSNYDDGNDGTAGECGGNIRIKCNKIENAHFLTLISNGSDGKDGLEGDNGEKGEDGCDVKKEQLENFRVGIFNHHSKSNTVSVSMSIGIKIGKSGKNYRQDEVASGKQGIEDTDGFYKIGYKHVNGVRRKGFLLVQGKDGNLWTKGTLGGFGGEGGLAGQILLEIANDDKKFINIIANNGKPGRNGKNGLNGVKGIDGRDAWVYDHNYKNKPEFFGLGENEKNKYEVVKSSKRDFHSIWCVEENAYMTVKLKSQINMTQVAGQRFMSSAKRSRALHAKVKIKKLTFKKISQRNYLSFFGNHLIYHEAVGDMEISNKFKTLRCSDDIKIIPQTPTSRKIYNFKEIERRIKNPMKIEDFLEIFHKSDLKPHDWEKLCKQNHSRNNARNFENFLSQSDISDLIVEKICILKFGEHCLHLQPQELQNKTFKNPAEINSVIPYLKPAQRIDTKVNLSKSGVNLGIDLALFHHYFDSDQEHNREQIRDVVKAIKKKCSRQKHDEDLIQYQNWICEIFLLLEKHKDVFDQDLKTEFNSFLAKSCELSLISRELSKNKKIMSFIKDNIIQEGFRSPIYRKLISIIFEVNLRIFGRNVDGRIFAIEEAFVSETYPVINLLVGDGKFTELKFNEGKFTIDSQKNEQEIELKGEIEKWRMGDFNYSLCDVLNNQNVDDPGKSIKILLKCVSEASNDDYQLFKLGITEVSHHKQLFKTFNTKLFYEGFELDIKELNLIIFSVLEVITQHPRTTQYVAQKLLTLKQSKWIVEIILFKLESCLGENCENYRPQISEVYHPILFLFLIKLELLQDNQINKRDIEKVIKNMKYFTQSTFHHLMSIQELESWQHVVTSEYWANKLSFLKNEKILKTRDLQISTINELQSKFGADILEDLFSIMENANLGKLDVFEFLRKFNTGEWIFSKEQFQTLKENNPETWISKISEGYASDGERDIEQIVKLIKKNEDTSESIKNNLEKIEKLAEEVRRYEIRNKNGFKLKVTQIVSVLTLLLSEKGVLMQIGTGEGKTYIGVAFAAMIASCECQNKCEKKTEKDHRKGEKIHIVTSSKVLAERDASNPKIISIFKDFGIKVGHNCHESSEERRRVYEQCDVVYGTLSNFQRDYLLTTFYDENILPEKFLQNVLVDEVDSILLDKGNNILYLSKDLPDVDTLESVFVFIWNWVNQGGEDLEVILNPEIIRKVFLDNLYGFVFESDIERLAKGDPEEIMKALRNNEIINKEGTIIMKEFNENVENAVTSMELSEESTSKILYYLEQKINSPKLIKFPKYHHNFVMRYLDRWIKSALNAMLMQEGVQYVIDYSHNNPTVQSDPNIVIVDIDTGTDQKNSEWDEGLCQFLQLKHGCRLSQLSLKSVFISNVSYFKLYDMKYGMTGTLGSFFEREKLNKFYDLDYATIPSYLPKKFVEYEAILTKTNDEWLESIVKEAEKMFDDGRSVLVICNTIKDIQAIENTFRSKNFDKECIKTYKRDNEKFDTDSLKPRVVILATNLAGRGTDITLSKELALNGGLHVILTYLPPNIRIENQAYGRAARAGAKGSARLIIMNASSSQTIKDLKFERDQQEQIRLEEVCTFYEKFIKIEENYFQKFMEIYKKYSDVLKKNKYREILLENLRVLWSLWLDQNSQLFKFQDQTNVMELFDTFQEKTIKENPLDVEFHPSLRIKYLKLVLESEGFEKAEKILQHEQLEDSLVADYYKILIELKITKEKVNEEKVLKTIKKFRDQQKCREHRANIIKTLKFRYQSTLKEITGFERMSKSFNEVDEIFIESLTNFLGAGITPESFNSCDSFINPIFKENFYQFLLNKNYIQNPTIKDNILVSDVESTAKEFHINPESLHNFIIFYPSTTVDLDQFARNLKQNFDVPSRDEFWDSLIESKILKNVEEYAIINIKAVEGFLPFIRDEFCYKFQKKFEVKKLEVKTNREIFFANIQEDNERIEKFGFVAFRLNEEIKSNKIYENLLKAKVVIVNKKATFDLEELEEIKPKFNFKNFDFITLEDFDFITSNRDEVVQEIMNADPKSQLKVIPTSQSFELENEINEYLRLHSVYRVELARIARLVREKSDKGIHIEIDAKHQLMLVQELKETFILKPSLVNLEKLNEFSSDRIFSKKLSNKKEIDFLESYFSISSTTYFSKFFNDTTMGVTDLLVLRKKLIASKEEFYDLLKFSNKFGPITLETFNERSPIKNSIFNKFFYEYLLQKNYIQRPVVFQPGHQKDISIITNKYGVHDAQYFFNLIKATINSNKNIDEELKKIYKHPSSEGFWDSLVDSKILSEVIEYAIIDMKAVEEFFPYIIFKFFLNFTTHLIKTLKVKDNREIFFSNMQNDNEKIEKFGFAAFQLNEEIKSSELFIIMNELKVVTINKKAIFNLNVLDKFVRNSQSQEIKVLNNKFGRKDVKTLSLNLSETENYVYEKEINEVLKLKFAYRIELERIAKLIREQTTKNFQEIDINIYTNPHLMLVNKLIEEQLILPSKVNLEKLKCFSKDSIFDKNIKRERLIEYLKNDFLPTSLSLSDFNIDFDEAIDALESKNFSKPFSNVVEKLLRKPKESQNINMVKKVKIDDVIKTINELKTRREKLILNKEKILEILINSTPKLSESKITLRPLRNFTTCTDFDVLECMNLKGLNSVIATNEEEKYSLTFWLNISPLTILVIAQIAVVAVVFAKFGLAEYLFDGMIDVLIINDLKFIYCSLRSGSFSWQDYASQKAKNFFQMSAFTAAIASTYKYLMKRFTKENSKDSNEEAYHVSEIKSKKKLEFKVSLSTPTNLSKEKIIKSAMKGKITAEMSRTIENTVMTALDSMTMAVLNAVDEMFDDCFSSSLLSYIAQLKYNEKYLKEVTKINYSRLMRDKRYLQPLIINLAKQVAEILEIELKNLNEFNSNSLDGVVNESTMNFLQNCIKDLSKGLKEALEVLHDSENIASTSFTFDKSYFLSIKYDFKGRVENEINRSIRVPTLKLITSKIEVLASTELFQQILENAKDCNIDNSTRDFIIRSGQKRDEEVSPVDLQVNQILSRKIDEIKLKSSNVATIKNLSSFSSLMTVIEVEAAARVCNVQLQIDFEGLKHVFGDRQCHKVEVSTPLTYERLYDILSTKIDLKNLIFADFREKTLLQIENDSQTIENTNKFSKFYGMKEEFDFQTKKGCKKFTSTSIDVKIKKFSHPSVKLPFKLNQDIREFDKNEFAMTVDTREEFNKKRMEAVDRTLVKIYELLQMHDKNSIFLTLDEMQVSKVAPILASNGTVYMPVAFTAEKMSFSIEMSLSFVYRDGKREIPSVNASVKLKKSGKCYQLQTLMPTMSRQKDIDAIPAVCSNRTISVDELTSDDKFIDLKEVLTCNYFDLINMDKSIRF